MAITKTDFMRGMQCPKMLWLDKHKPSLKVIPPEIQANEAGEEHVHVADSWGVDLDSSILHTLCWRQCSGDWPGCKSNCPLFTGPVTEWLEEQKRYETMLPRDPFSFMLNHYCSIDDNNCYVEEFDTLDGVHWEIAVDVADHLLEMLDEETKDE